jgi:type IX secretion system PorP/SprF family membrane protein
MKQKNTHILIVIALLLLFNLESYGQQDPMYTQYMYNTLSVNPAYAGSRDALSITGLLREQWVGIDGAPSTQSLVVHSPIYGDNMGLGLSVVNDQVGPIHQTMLFADYSYSIQTTDNAKLAFGLKAGMNILQGDLLSLHSNNSGDQAIYDISSKLLPNVGVGVYYYSDKGYLGLSAPKLLQQSISTYTNNNASDNVERRHYFLIGGYVFDLSEHIKFKPAFLVKAVSGAPLSIDLSGNFFFNEKFGVGLAHRFDDSFSGLLQYYVTPQFRIGYSYDFTTTDLRHYNSGSHELMLGYDFNIIEDKRIHSPRFF